MKVKQPGTHHFVGKDAACVVERHHTFRSRLRQWSSSRSSSSQAHINLWARMQPAFLEDMATLLVAAETTIV